MAETKDILKIKNHKLIIQTVDVQRNKSIKDTPVDASCVESTIPRKTGTNFYYIDINFSQTDLNFDNLDCLEDLLNGNPTVFPKRKNIKNNDYVYGYTCNKARLNDSGLFYERNGDEYPLDNITFDIGTRQFPNTSYYDEKIYEDKFIFDRTGTFEDDYGILDPNIVKIINTPRGTHDSDGYDLTFWVYGNNNPVNVYFNNENNEKVFINEDYTLVALLPVKSPNDVVASNQKLMYCLCQFCRGVSVKDEISDPGSRIKFEWKKLSLKVDGNYKSYFTEDEYNEIFTNLLPLKPQIYVQKDYDYKQKQKIEKVNQSSSVVYKIQSDTPSPDFAVEYNNHKSVMYDNRNAKEFNLLYKINNQLTFNSYRYGRYVYGLTTDQSNFGPDQEWSWSESWYFQKISKNSEILVDYFKYPLYSLELLKNYGIGFIISDWLFFDTTDNKYKVKFDPSYLWYWYHDKTGNEGDVGLINSSGPEIIDDKIYSTKYIFERLNETPEDEPIYTHYKNALIKQTIPFTNVSLSSKNIWILSPNDTLDLETISELMFSRTYPGTYLKSYVNGNIELVYPKKTPNSLTFVSYKWNNWWDILNKDNLNYKDFYEGHTDNAVQDTYSIISDRSNTRSVLINNKAQTIFTRYDVDLSVFDDTSEENLGPIYEVMTCWANIENDKNILLYPTQKGYNPNVYNYYTNDYTYLDNEYLIRFVNDEGNYVYLEPKYIMYKPALTDIYNHTFKVEDHPSIFNAGNEFYKNHTIYENEFKKQLKYSDIGPDGITEEEIYNLIEEGAKTFKYITPSEYYGKINQTQSLSEDEIPMNTETNDIKWFWLDTIKNWCRYEDIGNNILILKCWNGMNGWDSLLDIINLCLTHEMNELAIKYLYTSKFFHLGAYYGLDAQSTFSPIRYPDDGIGQISYMSLILDKETKSKTYNNFMQNLHRSKTYMNGEINNFSNYNYKNEDDNYSIKYNGEYEKLNVRITQKAIFGVSTQYCPVVVRLTNGNLAIMFKFQVTTNGYNIGKYTPLISADNANLNCIEMFGDGSDKTIENDWKHFTSTDRSEEHITEITTGNNETLYNAASLNLISNDEQINSMTLKSNRPNPTTQGYNDGDFLERWDK